MCYKLFKYFRFFFFEFQSLFLFLSMQIEDLRKTDNSIKNIEFEEINLINENKNKKFQNLENSFSIDNDEIKKLSAIFGPIIASKEEFLELFQNEKFGNFLELKFYEKYGFIKFSTSSETESFIEKFNNFIFKNEKLYVKSSIEKKNNNGIKTLHISGVKEAKLNERDLFYLVAPKGFVRRISPKKDFAFIEFDTAKDAKEAYDYLRSIQYKYEGLRVAFARSEHQVDLDKLSIPLNVLIPEKHPFWFKLQRRLFDH